MSKKLYAALLPVLAVVAFASMSGAAQAAPHWYACQKLATETGKFTDSECQKAGKGFWELKRLPFSETKFQVITFGTLKLTFGGLTFTCKVSDAGNIWNPVGEGTGKDEITQFANYECTEPADKCLEPAIEAVPASLPWPTELVAGTPIKDKIGTVAKPIEITVLCSKAAVALFKGQLEPNMVNPTESEPLFAEFTGTTGELENAAKEKAKVEGEDRILAFEHGEEIAVKNP